MLRTLLFQNLDQRIQHKFHHLSILLCVTRERISCLILGLEQGLGFILDQIPEDWHTIEFLISLETLIGANQVFSELLDDLPFSLVAMLRVKIHTRVI